jgi:cardiolipin synthase C
MLRLPILALVMIFHSLPCAAATGRQWVDDAVRAHPGQTGAYVLDRGEQALLARAWAVDSARISVDVQYFIWSTDNIGMLATETLLRAAERGVRVRVIVDDLLIDAPDAGLLAMSKHPNIDIRIYNPVHSVGVPWYKRLVNVATDLRGANQRMHDKTLIVDNQIAVTGGRNMADEYYDYDHAYNFRDRDVMLAGAVVPDVTRSFERFWASRLSVPVESLYDGIGLMQKHVTVDTPAVRKVYGDLHRYAADTRNFAPEVRTALLAVPAGLPNIAAEISWGKVDFISDEPGKNDGNSGLGGGGTTTSALAGLLQSAQREVLIESPYLVLSDEATQLLAALRRRGVVIRICTNSLASTDNLQAFSGYLKQREKILKMGIDVREYRPNPEVQQLVMQRYAALRSKQPVFALHAKTLVIDRTVAYIGTYNLDPRSQNLNTEVGAVIHNPQLAERVAAAITTDMLPANSWNAATDNPDQYGSAEKMKLVRRWQKLPLKPLL